MGSDQVTNAPALVVQDLHKTYGGGRHDRSVVHAVSDVSFEVAEGETLAVVGESGCGKTTLGRAILQLDRPTAGSVKYRNTELTALSRSELRRIRRHLQLVHQDPYGSLNPRMTAGELIEEPLIVHGEGDRHHRAARVAELLEQVELGAEAGRRYPHQFSGGQRQRIGIARALAASPSFVVCDEPVSALDVSVQAGILNLLVDLRTQLSLTYLFISHNLAVVRHIADRIAVMYLGQIVELAPSGSFFERPRHPYSMALLNAVPTLEGRDGAPEVRVGGDLPSPRNPPSGCRFHARCPFAQEICRTNEPEKDDVGDGHWVACHLHRSLT